MTAGYCILDLAAADVRRKLALGWDICGYSVGTRSRKPYSAQTEIYDDLIVAAFRTDEKTICREKWRVSPETFKAVADLIPQAQIA
jgi:hypothetical protein